VNVLKPHLQTTIWTLLKGGATQREIERITGISRHTNGAGQPQKVSSYRYDLGGRRLRETTVQGGVT
jgi:hypothetical protein